MALQTITTPHQILGGLKQWQQQLDPSVSLPVEPRPPWNLRITGGISTNALSWEKVPGAQGYEVEVSQNGDFSNAPVVATSSDSSDTSHPRPDQCRHMRRKVQVSLWPFAYQGLSRMNGPRQ
jgi:hypothetical protein